MVLDSLPAVMNKLVVKLMEGSIHTSENIIITYCHFLRLFKAFLKEFPSLKTKINCSIESVIKGRLKNSHKEKIPDIGEFLILVFLSDYS